MGIHWKNWHLICTIYKLLNQGICPVEVTYWRDSLPVQKGGRTMPNYIVLMKLTDQGIRTIRDTTQVIVDARKRLEQRGGTLTSLYLTMGEVDYVALCEVPNDDAAMAFVLGLGATGNVRTTTLKAFTTEEFKVIAQNIAI